MRVTCDSCGASYAIADAKVLGRLVKVRCKSCSGTILVDGRGPRAAAQGLPPTSLRSQPPPPVAPPLPPTSSIPPAIMPRAPSAPPAAMPRAPSALPAAAQPAPGAAWQGVPSSPPDDATQIWNRTGPSRLAVGGAEAEGWSVNLSDTDQRTMTTEQIIAGFLSGEVTDDAFVWKEGMDDWMPVLEVEELRIAIEQQQLPRSHQPLPAFNFSPGPAAVAQPALAAQPQTARVTGAVDHSADLFGGVDMAGSEGDTMDAPEPAPVADARMIGARNENSVLFSLDALKAGVTLPGAGAPAPARATPAPPAPPSPGSLGYGGASAPVDDILGFGSSGAANQLFSPEANQALLTAPAPEPEPPKPKPKAVEAIPSYGPPQLADKRVGIGIWIALAGLTVMLVAGALFGGLVLGRMGSAAQQQLAQADDSQPAKDDSKQTKASSPADQGKAQEKREGDKADEQKPVEQAQEKKEVSEEDRKRYEEAQKHAKGEKKATDQKTEAKPPKTEEKKAEEPGSGGTPFNKGAAIAALSSAASACSGCKRPDGPTGPGRVTVTFAPSGRVTSALVSGGSYGGTSVGGCVASVFRRAKVPPFDGAPVTVAKSFHIPP